MLQGEGDRHIPDLKPKHLFSGEHVALSYYTPRMPPAEIAPHIRTSLHLLCTARRHRCAEKCCDGQAVCVDAAMLASQVSVATARQTVGEHCRHCGWRRNNCGEANVAGEKNQTKAAKPICALQDVRRNRVMSSLGDINEDFAVGGLLLKVSRPVPRCTTGLKGAVGKIVLSAVEDVYSPLKIEGCFAMARHPVCCTSN